MRLEPTTFRCWLCTASLRPEQRNIVQSGLPELGGCAAGAGQPWPRIEADGSEKGSLMILGDSFGEPALPATHRAPLQTAHIRRGNHRCVATDCFAAGNRNHRRGVGRHSSPAALLPGRGLPQGRMEGADPDRHDALAGCGDGGQ